MMCLMTDGKATIMTGTLSRRNLLQAGSATTAALAVSALTLRPALAQAASTEPKEDFFYREDWFGEPWRKPETAVLIHGNAESSIVWYEWLPRMAQEFRVLRADLPGLGRSRIPAGFEWSLPSLATSVAHVLDKAGADSAHIIGAKAGGAIAMQFAADYPARTRTLSVVHVAIVDPNRGMPATGAAYAPQLARLGSGASKEMVAYWENLFATEPEIPAKALPAAVSKAVEAAAAARRGLPKVGAFAPAVLPPGGAKALVDKTCGTGCHAVEVVTSQRMDAAGWSAVVQNMVKSGTSRATCCRSRMFLMISSPQPNGW
jgi:pimeloyl-ACP methyl ester carboxylesterase